MIMRTRHSHAHSRDYATELTGFERRLLTGLAAVVAAGDDQAAAAASRGRRRGGRAGSAPRRLVAVAVAAAVVAVTLQVVDVGPRTVRERAGGGAPANATELAALAAKAAESEPTAKPSQWIYFKTLVAVVPPPSGVELRGRAAELLRSKEWWLRVDGTRFAQLEGGRVVVRRFSKSWRALNSQYRMVPTTADGALAWAYRRADAESFAYGGSDRDSSDRDVAAFAVIAGALVEKPLLPKAEAALSRAAARIPGVTMVKDIRDAAGRRGIALALAVPGSELQEREEVILDPRTFHYLGNRVGMRQSALLEKAIVDHPGQRR
jgi:hypothetical protein